MSFSDIGSCFRGEHVLLVCFSSFRRLGSRLAVLYGFVRNRQRILWIQTMHFHERNRLNVGFMVIIIRYWFSCTVEEFYLRSKLSRDVLRRA